MDFAKISTVLLEQQRELNEQRANNLVHREEEKLINLNSRLAQVVIGVRRSGKSTLCFNALEAAKVNYAYANFDDERFSEATRDDLNDILLALYKIYGQFEYLFLDEIQNVDAWPLFVNRLLRQGLHIILTGSNAKLLSSELATHLTGRHHKIELLPFSFKDWCNIRGLKTQQLTTLDRGLLAKAFDEYLRNGGFPELLLEADSYDYINALVDSIINQDIKKRFKVRNITELKNLSDYLLNIAPAIISKDTILESCEIKSDHTVSKFLSYLTQTYLISTINKYSRKSKKRICNPKYYAIDVALMDKRKNAFAGENLGWRLETIVYLELLRRYSTTGYDIYYHKERSAETDFIVCKGNTAIAIYQVCYDISSPKTFKREIRGCVAGAKVANCDNIYLITDHNYADIEQQNLKIAIRPAYEWLLG